MKVEIRTDDTAWAIEHGQPGRDGRTVVTVAAVEPVTFAGKRMVRFTLPSAPRDWRGQTTAMSPDEWVVAL